MKNKLIAFLLASAMTLSPALPATAAPAVNNTETVEEASADTDFRMGIKMEGQVIQDAEISLDEWDRQTEERKDEGLRNAFTEESLKQADPDAEILREDDRIYFIKGGKAFSPVRDAKDAYGLLYSLVGMLGGSEKTDLRLWSVITAGKETVYAFQQISDSEEVLGSTVKIAVSEDGLVTGVFSSLDPESTKEEKLVTRSEAEASVLQHLGESGSAPILYADYTQRTFIDPCSKAELLDLDEVGDPVPRIAVWVVYTSNGATEEEAAAKERSYVAHYVKLDGTYLRSLEVEMPGDEEALKGYPKPELYEGMQPAEWTGEIEGVNGEKRTVTVPVMHNVDDGRWYLGDAERRIVVADFAEAAYGDEHRIEIVSSDTNDWNNEDLYLLYNYIRAYDFYTDLGFAGPDGQDTDVVILKDMCVRDGTPFENACSIGPVETWQMFGFTPYGADGDPLGLAQAMDVMAHEFTHTVTGTLLINNLYENDQGAINEAMSDIMGNLTEYILEDTEDDKWLIGENTGSSIRNMSEPETYGQPGYVWDVGYGPHTDKPSDVNDRGGVHGNSSLLNRIAALLCMKYGMSYREAVAFWMMTAAGMTPGTDYVQIRSLLSWAAEESGNAKYLEAINTLADEEKLEETELPETLPEGQKIVKLRVPDTEAFKDDNWGLMAIQLNTERIGTIVSAGFDLLLQLWENPDDYAKFVGILEDAADKIHLDGNRLKLDEIDTDDDVADALAELVTATLQGIIFQSMTWREAGTDEMVMVEKDLPTVYILLNVSAGGTKIDGSALLLGEEWIDLGGMIKEAEQASEDMSEEEIGDTINGFLSGIFDEGETTAEEDSSIPGILDVAVNIPTIIDSFLNGQPDKINYLPETGLDSITVYKDAA